MINVEPFQDESQLDGIIKLIENDLSEPYCIYTYRFFIHDYPDLTLLGVDSNTREIVAVIICKIDNHRNKTNRGYIGMLSVKREHRKKGLASKLVSAALKIMTSKYKVDEIVLETEVTNEAAIKLYQNFGFSRDKRLIRYYLNGVDAYRLKLYQAQF